jgi:TonB family protein
MKKHHFFTNTADGRIPPFRFLLRVYWLAVLLAASGLTAADVKPAVEKPRVISEPIWAYPLAAAAESIHHGEVQAMLSIADDGTLTDFLLLGCSHQAFAQALAEALPEYRFSPARVRGEPTPVRMPVTFSFEHSGSVVSMSGSESLSNYIANLTDHRGLISWICPGDRLDRPLAVLESPSPAYPQELVMRGETGEVTIDFFIDGLGRVRVPAADALTHPSFGREAVAALRRWRFEPPTSRGEPVIVHVVQTFRFNSPSASRSKNGSSDGGGPRA